MQCHLSNTNEHLYACARCHVIYKNTLPDHGISQRSSHLESPQVPLPSFLKGPFLGAAALAPDMAQGVKWPFEIPIRHRRLKGPHDVGNPEARGFRLGFGTVPGYGCFGQFDVMGLS